MKGGGGGDISTVVHEPGPMSPQKNQQVGGRGVTEATRVLWIEACGPLARWGVSWSGKEAPLLKSFHRRRVWTHIWGAILVDN